MFDHRHFSPNLGGWCPVFVSALRAVHFSPQKMKVAAVLLSLLATVEGGAVSLTSATFETEVRGSGKNAFVKFFAPW